MNDKDTNWDILPLLVECVDKYGDKVLSLKEAAWRLSYENQPSSIWYNLDNDSLFIKIANDQDKDSVLSDYFSSHVKTINLQSGRQDKKPNTYTEESWVHIKSAYSPVAKSVTDLMALTPGPVNKWIGGPRPLTASLLGGLAGAGVGWLGGSLVENLTGDALQKKRLRKTLGLIGGIAGAAPGLGWAYSNVSQQGPEGLISSYPYPESIGKAASLLLPEFKASELFLKAADLYGDEPTQPIDVDAFNNVIWNREDIFTPSSLRAATTGITNSTAWANKSSLVTPSDIANLATGMGSGYIAGRIGGKVLGALAGLSPEYQKTLQTTGLWYGALKAVVPGLFGL